MPCPPPCAEEEEALRIAAEEVEKRIPLQTTLKTNMEQVRVDEITRSHAQQREMFGGHD